MAAKDKANAGSGPPSKPKWPQTPDGTTDWDVVFDDPKEGLIPLIGQSQSVAALRQGTLVVVAKLFTRDDDAPEVARYSQALDIIIANHPEATTDLGPIKEAVARLLGNIRDDRKERAREYIELKKRKAAMPDRRAKRKLTPMGVVFKFLLALSNPRVAVSFVVLAAALLAWIGVAVWQKQAPKRAPEVAAPQVALAPQVAPPPQAATQAAPEGTPAPAPEPVPSTRGQLMTRGMSPEDVPDEARTDPSEVVAYDLVVVMRAVNWPVTSRSRKDTYAALVTVPTADDIGALCGFYPRVAEALLLSFEQVGLSGKDLTQDKLIEIGTIANQLINARIGGGQALKTVIVRYGDPRFSSTSLPPCRLKR